MTPTELNVLADLEDRMAEWLFEMSKGPPIVVSAYDASLVSANRAFALRQIAAMGDEK